MMESQNVYEALRPLGLKPLNKAWAKVEIFLGLTCAFLGLLAAFTNPADIRALGVEREPYFVFALLGMALFVLGGYLAMAGHRSHLYQSMNQLTAFLAEEIRARNRGT